ncbi:MAG: L,D-transpeptidase family protein [Hyphomicrobiaceae bacterium]|nr:L,D-transpeptidase family protein [Hyphomicrobiaceae bacterium]
MGQRVVLLPGWGPEVRTGKVPVKVSRTTRKAITHITAGIAFATTIMASGVAWADVGSERWARSWGDTGRGYSSYGRHLKRSWETQLPVGHPTLSKSNLAPLSAAIKQYQVIVAGGGWEPIPMLRLRPGTRHRAVVLLRRRLELTRDIPQSRGRSARYDYRLTEGVRRFQVRHGLKPTGQLDKSTILALNVPAKARLQQLKTNLVRLRKHSRSASKKYVAVNIPAAQIEAVENDQVVSRHAAVVGKVDRQTPVLRSQIHQINFNPYWNIPRSIVKKDLVPKARLYARRGKDILSEYRIDAFKGGKKLDPRTINWSSPAVYSYRYRQEPWKDNSMGFVKINFHNAHSVYLHDTPSKSLFARNFRAQSSGCVRVQNVKQLVSWLLESNGGWDYGKVAQLEQNGVRKDVSLKRRVPLYLVYVTAWATKDGTVNFRRDIYGRDRVGATASAY